MAQFRGRHLVLQRCYRKKTMFWVSISLLVTVVLYLNVHTHVPRESENLPDVQIYPSQKPVKLMLDSPTQIHFRTIQTKDMVKSRQNSTRTPHKVTTRKRLNTTKADRIMQERRELVRKACLANKNTTDVLEKFKPLISRRHQLLYCPVAKVASTFWSRFLYQLDSTDLRQSPFAVSVQNIYGGEDLLSSLKLLKGERTSLKKLLSNSTKLIFVRDPYSRLLSAYVDKLLAPNPIYWDGWGKKAIWWYRTPLQSDSQCSENVTFSEFVSFALNTGSTYDRHIMPIDKQCSPCFANYTVIGKMETFQSDLNLLLSLMNISATGKYLEEIQEMKNLDAIEDSVHDAFSEEWMTGILKCSSKDEAARRIWRKLQIRGVLSWRSKYHLDFKTAQNMSGSEYIEILMKTLKDSKPDKRELKVQKRQAYMEAFSTLTRSQLEEIATVFNSDLKMFGYEKLSAESLRGEKVTGALDWRKDWDLRSVL